MSARKCASLRTAMSAVTSHPLLTRAESARQSCDFANVRYWNGQFSRMVDRFVLTNINLFGDKRKLPRPKRAPFSHMRHAWKGFDWTDQLYRGWSAARTTNIQSRKTSHLGRLQVGNKCHTTYSFCKRNAKFWTMTIRKAHTSEDQE